MNTKELNDRLYNKWMDGEISYREYFNKLSIEQSKHTINEYGKLWLVATPIGIIGLAALVFMAILI